MNEAASDFVELAKLSEKKEAAEKKLEETMEYWMELEELAAWVKCHRHAARHWFTVQDLFYLKRGGRLSTAEALVGTALKIRPVLLSLIHISMTDCGRSTVASVTST